MYVVSQPPQLRLGEDSVATAQGHVFGTGIVSIGKPDVERSSCGEREREVDKYHIFFFRCIYVFTQSVCVCIIM